MSNTQTFVAQDIIRMGPTVLTLNDIDMRTTSVKLKSGEELKSDIIRLDYFIEVHNTDNTDALEASNRSLTDTAINESLRILLSYHYKDTMLKPGSSAVRLDGKGKMHFIFEIISARLLSRTLLESQPPFYEFNMYSAMPDFKKLGNRFVELEHVLVDLATAIWDSSNSECIAFEKRAETELYQDITTELIERYRDYAGHHHPGCIGYYNFNTHGTLSLYQICIEKDYCDKIAAVVWQVALEYGFDISKKLVDPMMCTTALVSASNMTWNDFVKYALLRDVAALTSSFIASNHMLLRYSCGMAMFQDGKSYCLEFYPGSTENTYLTQPRTEMNAECGGSCPAFKHISANFLRIGNGPLTVIRNEILCYDGLSENGGEFTTRTLNTIYCDALNNLTTVTDYIALEHITTLLGDGKYFQRAWNPSRWNGPKDHMLKLYQNKKMWLGKKPPIYTPIQGFCRIPMSVIGNNIYDLGVEQLSRMTIGQIDEYAMKTSEDITAYRRDSKDGPIYTMDCVCYPVIFTQNKYHTASLKEAIRKYSSIRNLYCEENIFELCGVFRMAFVYRCVSKWSRFHNRFIIAIINTNDDIDYMELQIKKTAARIISKFNLREKDNALDFNMYRYSDTLCVGGNVHSIFEMPDILSTSILGRHRDIIKNQNY